MASFVVACGSGATRGPDDDVVESTTDDSDATDGDDDDEEEEEEEEEEEFSWGLPGGDLSPAEFERDVYRELRNSCSGGQNELDERWDVLQSPRTVLLYQAGIYVCSGALDQGREMFERAGEYGWSGIDTFETDCNVYRAIVSVLQQVEPASISCPGGDSPGWPDSDPLVARDDPRTAEDESATATTDSSTGASTHSTTSSSTLPPSADGSSVVTTGAR